MEGEERDVKVREPRVRDVEEETRPFEKRDGDARVPWGGRGGVAGPVGEEGVVEGWEELEG